MPNNKYNSKAQLLPFVVFTTFVFVALCYKAGHSSFTHDESLSYIRFVFTGDYFAIGDTNNHILNSTLMFLSSMLLGESEFTLRFPNLLSYLLYAFFTFKIVGWVKNYEVRVLGFFMLNSIPFILDFFALARGYGLALGLFSGYIYFLLYFLKTDQPKYLFYALVLISLASLAVMTFGYFLAPIVILSLYVVISKRSKHNKAMQGQLAATLLGSFGVILMFYVLGTTMKDQGAFFFGDTSLSDAMSTLLRYTSYGQSGRFQLSSTIVALILILLSIKYFRLWKQDGLAKAIFTPFGLCVSLMLICVMEMIFQHYLLGTNYPPARAIQYFIPLFLLILIFWLDGIGFLTRRVLVGVLAVIFTLNLAHGANLERSFLWAYDSETKKHFKVISEAESDVLTVTSHALYRPTFNFYSLLNQSEIYIVQDANPQYLSDFVINNDSSGFSEYRVISASRHSNLMKLESRGYPWDDVKQFEITDSVGRDYSDFSDEFLLLKKYSIPNPESDGVMIYIEFSAGTPSLSLLTAHIVVTCSGGEVTPYYNGILSNYNRAGLYSFRQGFWLAPKEFSGKTVNIYLWNLDRQIMTVEDLKITWYKSK